MNTSPPKLPLHFLRWFCHPNLLPSIEGDLIELFEENVKMYGSKKARRLFTFSVLNLLRPSLAKNKDYCLDPGDFRPGTRFLIQLVVSLFGAFLLIMMCSPTKSIGDYQVFKDKLDPS